MYGERERDLELSRRGKMLLYRELRASPFREVKSGYTVGTQRLSLGRFIIPWPFNHETSKSDLFLLRITKRLNVNRHKFVTFRTRSNILLFPLS